jgi:hypothetical protein
MIPDDIPVECGAIPHGIRSPWFPLWVIVCRRLYAGASVKGSRSRGGIEAHMDVTICFTLLCMQSMSW